MSATLRIDTVESPIGGGTASISGRYTSDSSVSSISVTWRDAQDATVTALASFSGGAWSVSDVDVSTLHPGAVVALVTLTASSDAAFDAASTTINAGYPHVTGTPWATHVNVRQSYDAIPLTDADVDEACWIASDILYRFTGSRWPGICHVDKLRPMAQWRQYDRPGWWQTNTWAPNGRLSFSRYGWCACNRGRDWGCNSIPEISLPHGSVHEDSIVVMIDGNQFDGWSLRDGRWLQRTDLSGWPCCQLTHLPDTEVGTWSVSYSYGSGPDAGGVRAAAALGYQMALAFDDKANDLPRRVRQLSRAGTQVALLDPLTLFDQGLTGITEVDIWVKSIERGNKMRPATIHAVGKMPRFRHE